MTLGFNFLIFLTYAILGLSLGLLLLTLNYILSPKSKDSEKVSNYECGFDSFSDSRMRFDIHFYIVAILFLIFDLEVIFLFPWVLSIGVLSSCGFWSMMFFMLLLGFGFVYEWCKGALEW